MNNNIYPSHEIIVDFYVCMNSKYMEIDWQISLIGTFGLKTFCTTVVL